MMSNGSVLIGDLTYKQIRRDIIRCVLAPGERISNAELAKRYGVSIGVARRVLDRLCQDDLVEVLPREGYLISPITLGGVQDLLAARIAYEPVGARLAAGKLSAEQVQRLRELCEVSRQSSENDQLEAANTEFHLIIAQATGIRRVLATIRLFLEDWERLVYFGGPLTAGPGPEEADEHEAVVVALAAGNAAKAEQAMQKHLETSRLITLVQLSGNPEFADVVLTTR
jgi:DNA-binding GntR family transcriptional regulator